MPSFLFVLCTHFLQQRPKLPAPPMLEKSTRRKQTFPWQHADHHAGMALLQVRHKGFGRQRERHSPKNTRPIVGRRGAGIKISPKEGVPTLQVASRAPTNPVPQPTCLRCSLMVLQTGPHKPLLEECWLRLCCYRPSVPCPPSWPIH